MTTELERKSAERAEGPAKTESRSGGDEAMGSCTAKRK